jgi:TonB-linked SusC/RagA family outer membrane protein
MLLTAYCNRLATAFLKNRQEPHWFITKTLRVMKLTALMLLICGLSLSAKTSSQTITFSGKNVSLEKVFAAIEAQTGYVVIGSARTIKSSEPVTLQVSQMPLSSFMGLLLKSRPFDFEIRSKTIFIKEKPAPRASPFSLFNRGVPPITGYIRDAEGNPLSGATVRVKRGRMLMNNAVVTDSRGRFTIRANEGEILVISYIGFVTQEHKVSGTENIDIVLERTDRELEIATVVVNTGYQRISKERATGAYDVVNKDMLQKRPISNLSTALQGMVPGMQGKEKSDGSFNFLVRGTSSMYADSKPLVVVDGFPVADTSFTTINPNDIESVTVLKDAAAASIWGARSANGVIVITTKQAKAGQKLRVEVNAFTRIGDKIDLNQVTRTAGTADFIRYEELAWKNNWALSKFSGSFNQLRTSLTLAQELLYANETGKISSEAMNRGLDSLRGIDNRGQIEDLLLERPVLSQFNINISGGTDKLRSLASFMFEKNKDGFVGNKYNRFMFNFNNQYRPTKFLSFFVNASVQYTDQTSSGATVSEIEQLSPYETLLNPDGAYSVNLKNINRQLFGTLPASSLPYQDWSFNLLREVRERKFSTEDLNARFQVGMSVSIFKGLSFDSRLQYERRKTDYKNYYSEGTFFARDMVNYNIEYTPATQTVGKVFLPKGGIETPRQFGNNWINNTTNESYLFRNQLNFDRYFGRKHAVTAIAGFEVSQYEVDNIANPWLYGYYPDKLQSSAPPFGYGSAGNTFKNITGSSGVTLQGGNPIIGWGLDRYVSFYGNASYTYEGKYTLSGSIRADASNYITDDPSLRWSPFWSVGGAWNLGREDFIKAIPFIDQLSLRATYGRNGNAEKGTSTKTLLSVGTSLNATTGTIIASISDYGNPLLRWEKTTTTNIGVDFSLFKGKLSGKIDYYKKNGSDLVGLVTLAAANGTTSQKFNNAKLVNNGIELALGTQFDIPGIPVQYQTMVTYAYNKNEITDLYYPAIYGFDMLGGNAFVQGRPIQPVYSYTYLGMKDGEPYVAGVKGAPNRFDDLALHNRGLGLQFLNYEGTAIPPHTMSWLNTFRAFNFSLNVLFTGTMGGVYRNPVFNYATTIGGSKTFVDRFVSEVFAGNPDIPSFPQPNDPGTYRWDRYAPNLQGLVESSSYIECKEIMLDYTFPKKLSNAVLLEGIRVYAQARNLGLVYRANSRGFHPDWLPGSYRPLRTVTLGCNIQF